MMIVNLKTKALAFAKVSLAAIAYASLGVSTPAAAQATVAEEDKGGIKEIVVTARKREESTQDVPVSVSVIDIDTLQNRNITTLESVAAISPQFTIGRAPSGSGATLVLRGIGSNSTSIGLEQSVAVVVDGVYYGQGRTINEGFFDLGRVELLKGPQALFFGKNATAGVVSITTADPGKEAEIQGRIGYEHFGETFTGEGIFSTPLSDTLGLRVALRYTKSNGGLFKNLSGTTTYTTNDRATTAIPGVLTPHVAPAGPSNPDAFRDLLGRVTIKWTPSDATTVAIKGSFSDDRRVSPAGNAVIYRCPTGTYQFNAAISCGSNFSVWQSRFPADIAATVPYAQTGDGLGNRYRAWAITGSVEHELDNFTLTWVNNYNWNRNIFIFDGDFANSPTSAVQVFATEWSTFKAFSSEARVQSSFDGPINGMLGAYYQKTNRDYLAWTASGALENSLAPKPFQRFLANSKDSETDGKTLALFGQLAWKVVSSVELAAGARYTHETKDSYFLQPYSHPIRVAQGIFSPGVTLPSAQTFNDWSPEATITWQASDDVTAYAAYKTAYKSGGFSNSGILSPTAGIADFEFEPETASGFEGGIKTLLADRQLRLNLGLYSYKYKNLQLDFFRSDIFAFSTINAGSARTKGVEVEFQYAPRSLAGFDLHGSLNYNKARYGDAPGAPCYQGQTPLMGCTVVVGQGPRQNLRGLPTAMAPKWTGTLGVNFDTDVAEDLKLGVSVDGRYSGKYITSAFGNFLTEQKSYVQLDASARLRTADEHFEVALIGKNLTNRFYRTGGTDAPNTGSGAGTAAGVLANQIGYVAQPRTLEAQITFRY
jgi:outer membrane receptor protein involved in Fe transport